MKIQHYFLLFLCIRLSSAMDEQVEKEQLDRLIHDSKNWLQELKAESDAVIKKELEEINPELTLSQDNQKRFHDLEIIYHDLNFNNTLHSTCACEIRYGKEMRHRLVNFINLNFNLVDQDIIFNYESPWFSSIIKIIPLIPPVLLKDETKLKLNNLEHAQKDYSDFFKIFLKVIIQRGPKVVINNIQELITAIIPTVIKDQGEQEKQLGISKLTYLTTTLLESYIDILSENKEINVSMKYLYDDAIFGVKKLEIEESAENFILTLNTYANLFDNLPDNLYSIDEKNSLKNGFLDEFKKEEKENKLNYKKFLIPFLIFTGGWSIFTTILYKKQWLPASLQEFISKQIQIIKSK